MSKAQKGPWEIDEWSNIIDAEERVVILTGIKNPAFGHSEEVGLAVANRALVFQAPSLNHVVGKLLDIMSNPYSNNDQRMDKIYILTEELRSAYVDGADYEE